MEKTVEELLAVVREKIAEITDEPNTIENLPDFLHDDKTLIQEFLDYVEPDMSVRDMVYKVVDLHNRYMESIGEPVQFMEEGESYEDLEDDEDDGEWDD